MPTRLKRLELHGFKSFAASATFVFDPGITAIIGPNGSGKSNIADALRWVLGEQSYASLRGRRTEDVIFSGSASRAPFGMAEVALTLDNESGDLPLPFAEITITRRAFRSGENQYLINGARVRHKDVMQLTASLGQAYTVIGQGLVDAVLSQRPEERRGLFEHAAGITGLRLRHREAERQLAETQGNITRLEDLLGEIEPRLRSLERAARHAREYEQVRGQLRSALERSYRVEWQAARERLAEAERACQAAETARHQAAAALTSGQAQAVETERQCAEARQRQQEYAAAVQALRDRQRTAAHRLALVTERRVAQQRYRDDLARGQTARQEALAALSGEHEAASAALCALDADMQARQEELTALEAADAAARSRRDALQAELRQRERAVSDLERGMAAAEARLGMLDQQRADLEASRARQAEAARARDARAREIAAQTAAAADDRAAAARQVDALLARQAPLEREATDNARQRETGAASVRDLERRLVQRSTRLETLERLRDSGAGLFAGTRAVLDAARARRLGGIVGALASLLRVPAELEAAIEAALGGHLQDVVVERWADAERAIDLLKRTNAGRATFQPLDTVRGPGRQPPPRLSEPGVVGAAAGLIDFDPRVEPVVLGLLGRVLVVEDLTTSRTALRGLPGGWSIVTLAGEITRGSGAVTGGARVRESGHLARERELRDLPAACQALQAELDQARAASDDLTRVERAITARRQALDRDLATGREALLAAESALAASTRWRQELETAERQAGERAAALEQRLSTNQHEQARLSTERDALAADLATARQARERCAARLTGDRDQQQAALHGARAALRELRERRRGIEQQLARLDAQGRALAQEVDQAAQRRAELDREAASLEREAAALEAEQADGAAALERATAAEAAAAAALEALAAIERAARQGIATLEARLREQERLRDQRALEVERRRDALALIRERAGHDLEAAELDGLLSPLPVAEPEDPATLQREVARLRERLRRIGAFGEDAVAQYEQEAERYTFLRGQLDDVKTAGDALRALLARLERTMAEGFDRAFGEVATAFEATFVALFGGGKARLVRASDQDGGIGVDVVAQPPGKRLQSLALLSGGERALTAVALLFAILKVNPSPFCLLDEIDAALDEANVVRVGNELRALAERTQFVLVTHNRATIEAADTLYGITMGSDGVSQVLSLRLAAEAPV